MLLFILRKTLRALLTMFLVVTFTFLILRISGDPTEVMFPDDVPQEVKDAYRTAWGLDRPLPEQFAKYLVSVGNGDLGYSFRDSRPALDVVTERIPATLRLGLCSFALSVCLGIPLGLCAAFRRNTFLDRLATSVSVMGYSMPNFFLGILLILLFSLKLRLLPSSGAATAEHLIMPVITLGTATAGIVPDFVPGSPVYDRAPIEEGIDFTAGGVPDSLHVLYAHRTDTAAPLAYGLPTDAGTYHITATLLHNDNRRHYGQTPFDITIAKAEWDGERNAEGTVAAGHSDSLALPAIPEGAYYGTPSGDPRILDLRIADGYLHYTGGSGIEPGGSYTLVVPVGEGVNYHIYAIVVQLTGFGTSGVPSADGPSLRITTTGGQLHIAGSDERATVYDLHGRQVYQGFDRTIGLPEGVYMVRVGSEGRKVIVHP